MSPRCVGDRVYFISNLSGRMSLYAMDAQPGGSTPEPLLPPDIALQNPALLDSYSFYVFPKLRKIIVMIDRDGDENYQPTLIPIAGGYPEPIFAKELGNTRVHLVHCDEDRNLAYFVAESRTEQLMTSYRANLATGKLTRLGSSKWGSFVAGVSDNHKKVVLSDGYTSGDNVLYFWQQDAGERKLLHGVPLEARKPGQQVPLEAIGECHFIARDAGLLFTTATFTDTYSLGYLDLKSPDQIQPVKITGVVHKGVGELVGCRHLDKNRYALEYNIDGCSWLYDATYHEKSRTMKLTGVLVGKGALTNGELQAFSFDKKSGAFALSFSTATTPSQLYLIRNKKLTQLTRERVLGIPAEFMSPGEDASFTSHDGLRVSARLYLPAPALKLTGPRPLVYYVHGGPQSQERPNFAWFSMPLIQYLTMNGFAVFVPNARGSTGYGLSYMKRVDKDWGGADRLDHVFAMTKVLPKDKRLDVSRAGVVGRSYGGFMTLTLASRHPDLWSAAVDMFGPSDLINWVTRIPETWKPYFALTIGDPVKDRDELIARSPKTYLAGVSAPMLVIQGKNDPRVTHTDSEEVVEQLKAAGKSAELLLFDNEGHDVLKFENKVRCYTAITEFFRQHLKP